MSVRLYKLLPALLVLITPIAAAESEEGVDDDALKRCINVGSILQTRIIDDNNIVFMMRRDEMYLNTLRSNCTGLSRRGRFAYKTQTRSLCELERITVIEDGTIGQPLGRSCTLGQFRPVTMEDLAVRFEPTIRQRQNEKIAEAQIEEVAAEEAEEQSDDAK